MSDEKPTETKRSPPTKITTTKGAMGGAILGAVQAAAIFYTPGPKSNKIVSSVGSIVSHTVHGAACARIQKDSSVKESARAGALVGVVTAASIGVIVGLFGNAALVTASIMGAEDEIPIEALLVNQPFIIGLATTSFSTLASVTSNQIGKLL